MNSHRDIDPGIIAGFHDRLEAHPIYAAVDSIERLRVFMQHHVYSVWDFMSLIKFLQSQVAPTRYPWIPPADAAVSRFINELVLEEESDVDANGEHCSHFALYLRAMREIGADTAAAEDFVATVADRGIEAALTQDSVPAPSRAFTTATFRFIDEQGPHRAAAALALGREHIIPGMFRAILQRTGVTDKEAPMFHYYLNRHIHLDEDFHAPLSLRLLNSLCAGDAGRVEQAVAAATRAGEARLAFWDGVLEAVAAV